MKTSQQLKAVKERKAKRLNRKRRIAALCLPISIIIVIVMSTFFVKEKTVENYHSYDSYDAHDVALFVALPLLNAVIK